VRFLATINQIDLVADAQAGRRWIYRLQFQPGHHILMLVAVRDNDHDRIVAEIVGAQWSAVESTQSKTMLAEARKKSARRPVSIEFNTVMLTAWICDTL